MLQGTNKVIYPLFIVSMRKLKPREKKNAWLNFHDRLGKYTLGK